MTPTYFFLAAHEICQIENLTARLRYICQPQQAIIWQEMALSTEQHCNVTHRNTVSDKHLLFVGSHYTWLEPTPAHVS